MGLAAFGQHTELAERLQDIFFYENDLLRRYPTIVERQQERKLPWIIDFREKTSNDSEGQDYNYASRWLNHWLSINAIGYSKEDIAYAVQYVAENVVIKEIRRFLHQTNNSKCWKIALAGGVFANVRMNQKILELPEVENVFIQPAMNDAGLSLGAAMLAERSLHNASATYPISHAYLGADFNQTVEDFITEIPAPFIIKKMRNTEDEIAELLANDKIIGFYHGRMEYGPRALGHRSIIANPFRREINKELNTRLNRTEFMPFAPSILDVMAPVYLIDFCADCPASEFMTITFGVKEEYQNLLQAVVHVDGTCRPHVVKLNANPYFYNILKAFYQKTNCGAIINTSFNAHEEPIIATPKQAFNALAQGRIDVLILEDYCIQSPH